MSSIRRSDGTQSPQPTQTVKEGAKHVKLFTGDRTVTKHEFEEGIDRLSAKLRDGEPKKQDTGFDSRVTHNAVLQFADPRLAGL